MILREATEKDKFALINLYEQLRDDYTPNLNALLYTLSHICSQVFVLEHDRKVVATGTLSVRAVPSTGLVGFIDDVVVDRAYRGKGFGKAMSKHLIELARRVKCMRVELTSRPHRISAIQMYRSLGFKTRDTNFLRLELE